MMQTFMNDNLITTEYSWKKLKLIWIIAFIAGFTLVARDSETARETLIGFGQLHRITGITILGVIFILFFIRQPSVLLKSIFFFLSLFCLWQITTAAWSNYPSWTIYRSAEYLIVIGVTAYVANSIKDSPLLFFKWINLTWFLVGLLLLSVWLAVIIFPNLALVPSKGIIPFMIGGVYPRINPNSVSAYAAIIGIVSFVRLNYSSEKKWKIFFLLAIITMILSQGRSGMVGFALGIIIAIMLIRKASWALIIATLIGIMISYFAFDELFWEYFRRGQTERQFIFLSGRVTAWQYAYDSFIQHQPLTGFGAYSAGRFLVLGDFLGWSSLHSTWVELAVGIGIPATLFFALIIIYAWIALVKFCVANYKNEYNIYFIEIASVFTVLIVRSFFTTQFIIHSDFVFFLIMGTVFYIKNNTLNLNRLN